jgi:hypothetical protein
MSGVSAVGASSSLPIIIGVVGVIVVAVVVVVARGNASNEAAPKCTEFAGRTFTDASNSEDFVISDDLQSAFSEQIQVSVPVTKITDQSISNGRVTINSENGILQNCSSYDLRIDGSGIAFITDGAQLPSFDNFSNPVIAQNTWDFFSPVSNSAPTSLTMTVTGSSKQPKCDSIALQYKTFFAIGGLGVKLSTDGETATFRTAYGVKSIATSNSVISISDAEKIAGKVLVLNCSGKTASPPEQPDGSDFPNFFSGQPLADDSIDKFLFEPVDTAGTTDMTDFTQQMFAAKPSTYTFSMQ